jgi:hypothetical protein
MRFTRSNFYPVVNVNGTDSLDLLNNYFNIAFKISRPVSYYTIRELDLFRPDLLSYKLYGDTQYWWILFKYNNISDVWNDLSVEQVISVPDIGDYEDFYSETKKLQNI